MSASLAATDLDRSPSLSSASSTSTTTTTSSAPLTPALSSTSTSEIYLSSPALPPSTPEKTPFPRLSKTPTSASSPWKAGHRANGAGSKSFDAARAAWANLESEAVRSPSPERRGMGGTPFADSSNYRSSIAPGSPTRFSASPTRTRPALPTIPSDRPSYSPSSRAPASPSQAQTHSDRILSSAIFATRPTTPSLGPNSPLLGRETSLRRAGMGHKRAMTLPQLGLGRDGLPVPLSAGAGGAEGGLGGEGGLVVEEDVPGLPGRARLSRPADSLTPSLGPSPSSVFHSSHGRPSTSSAAGPKRSTTMSLLPSMAAKAIDRQRQGLVAYEYLCHLAEARDWLETHITTLPSSTPLWDPTDTINDFEQSLRNGYALAHLARSLGGERCQGPIYNDPVRHFRHTVNINIFFQLLDEVGLPEIFRFETVDLYDAKNLPKVVYCLHALSHLMARRGLTDRMHDLVGQIEFTDAEVGAAQKGLSDAGVRMPNFAGIGKALDKHESPPAAPPPETEGERRERLLSEAEGGVRGLQACARGVLVRRWVEKERRRREVEERRRREEEAEARRRAEELEAQRRAEEAEARRRKEEEDARRAAEEEERRYQAAVREAATTLVGFQAAARGAIQRRRFFAPIEQLAVHNETVTAFQAAARGTLARRELRQEIVDLKDASPAVTAFQTACRGALARQALLDRIRHLRSAESFIVGVQSRIRGHLARQDYRSKARNLRKTEVVKSVGGLQSLARAALARRRVKTQRQELGFVEPDVVGIQAQTRGFLGRTAFLAWHQHVHENEGIVVFLQSLIRGAVARNKYFAVHQHLQQNMSNVVRLQAAIRSRRQGSQYRQLRVDKNVPVSTIKNFMRLLDDSEFDYRGELQLESLRKELVSAIRETQELEDDVKDLDTKIALLVKNKITHEVARAQRANKGTLAPLKRSSLLSAANDPFAGGTLDHHTQRKLDLYQQLFWHLQTKPAYLAKLFANMSRMRVSEKTQKQIEATTFVMFGYAQGHREEFLLLKLFQRSIQEEFANLANMAAFVRGNFTFVRLLVHYGRGVQQRQYLAGALATEIKAVMGRQGLDLGTDPIAIYQAELEREESRTGLPSQRPEDVDYAHALADRETNALFIQHLIALRKATTAFLRAIFTSTARMPFGIRYVAREIFRALRARFPNEPEHESLRIAGHVVYYRFLQPAIVAPETFGIVEGVVPPIQRQNLGEVCKMLNQISVGRLFGSDQEYLMPMNDFITSSAAEFTQWIFELIHIEDAETYFRADEYVDAAASRRPVIYISPNDIYATHSILVETLDVIAPEEDDPVRQILVELGGVPTASSAELERARADEVALTLATRLLPHEDPDAESKHLFNQAKRRVLAILKVQHGNNLEAVLAQQVTPEDEDAWIRIVEEEEEEERRLAHAQRRAVVPQMDDIRNMSFHQLKMATLSDIVELRRTGMVAKNDKYQAILNAIAHDIRSKHHRRVQRQNELQTMHATLSSLKDKKRYLDDQIKSYHVYIDQSMAGIQKKSKKRIVLPWSIQGVHQRQLEKQGKKYKFGSYKYTAQTLYERGVLLSIEQVSPKTFDKVSMTFSSDNVGVFEIKVEFTGKTLSAVELKLEDLLEAQWVGKQTVAIGEAVKMNLVELLDLINRKFYQ
ncbi:iqgap-related protein [Rhodotorula toruloides]|uniref:BY PROTMAP: gi/472585658/gb/EMS23209.1/ Ras GTPase-activating protein [Rhodosporidium toruloides NP11] gi/647400654/emb/CDR46321.1/ RHTO0S12e02960g1_1 [Rhodosporidium toruloides] n=1 Tax=Rhodotorula toruloides TaxID=5286 RepID=A0A0K3CQH9_RHOTO|nr:hypothetical protein AAT19DRAFT_10913 [Rhodotorula toruloides]